VILMGRCEEHVESNKKQVFRLSLPSIK
jgi:hypothetical protein